MERRTLNKGDPRRETGGEIGVGEKLGEKIGVSSGKEKGDIRLFHKE